jgi:hypothetical protein
MDKAHADVTNPRAGRHPLAWVPTLYLAQGLPFYSVALVAGLMFKSMGVPNEQIARWTGLLGLAWVFKALWSPFLELARSKKRVVVLLQVLGGAALGRWRWRCSCRPGSRCRSRCWAWCRWRPAPTTSPPTACISPACRRASRPPTPAGRAPSSTAPSSCRWAAW